ncbi:MAG: PilZ domain-containing protein [Thermoanaerobaculia bacterium]
MATARPERRRSPRIRADEASRGQLKATIPVTIRDLSADGLLLELRAPLRPGMTYDLEAQFPRAKFAAAVRVTRCRTGGYAEDGRGGRCLLFHAGAEFVGLTPAQSRNVARALESATGPADEAPGILQRG